MDIFNLKTTVRNEALASSFIANESYFVSTVNQQLRQSSYPTKYSTIIKKSGGSFEPFLILNTDSAAEAAANHIALIRMACSIDRDEWSKNEVVGYQPIAIMKELKSENKEPNNFSSNYCKFLLSTSQINITKQNKGIFPKILLALTIFLFFIIVSAKILNKEESSSDQKEQATNEIFSEKYIPNSNSFEHIDKTELSNESRCNNWFEANFGNLDPTFNNYPINFPNNKEFNDRMMSVLIQNQLDFLARDYYRNINLLINSQELPSFESNHNLIRNLTNLNEIELANMFKLAIFKVIHNNNFSCN